MKVGIPRITCSTCLLRMQVPATPLSTWLVTSKQEALDVCKADTASPKVLRCRNPQCMAHKRAIVMPRSREAEITAVIESWQPISTYRVRYDTDPGMPDNDYAVLEFAIDPIERTPDISLSDSVDVEMLRRMLDGFGRELAGVLTIQDFFCWGPIEQTGQWLLHPIEAFLSHFSSVPPRFNPFCAAIRRLVHQRTLRLLRKHVCSQSCPYKAQDCGSTDVVPHRPVCQSCVVSAAHLEAAANSDGSEIALHKCYLYTDLLRETSPCYRSDCAQFLNLLTLTQEPKPSATPGAATKEPLGVLGATEAWRKDPFKYTKPCWAGFIEISLPLLMHGHLVGMAMTGQMISLPDAASREQTTERLREMGRQATQAAMREFSDSSSQDLSKLASLFEPDEWARAEESSHCRWLVRTDELQARMQKMRGSIEVIERYIEERYTQERRLREQYFREELNSRFEIQRRARGVDFVTVLPALLRRMADFWAFEEAAYLSATPRTEGKLALVAHSHSEVIADDNAEPWIPSIVFTPTPPTGMLLTARGPDDFDKKPGCTWQPMLRELSRVLRKGPVEDLVAYVSPTVFGQDLFVFHRRDLARVSRKPRLEKPSLLCQESIKAACSDLSTRITDWNYFKQQLFQMHIYSHTLRTPLETIRLALDNIGKQTDLSQNKSYRNANSSIRDVCERVNHFLTFTNAMYTQRGRMAAPGLMDVMSTARRIANACRYRYEIDYEFKAGAQTQWWIAVPLQVTKVILSNILGNAFKYSYKGRTVRISLREQEATEETVLTVENLGDGLLPEEQKMIGRPFFRGYAVQQKPGTGLGLFLIDQLLGLLELRWSFESRPSNEYVDITKGRSFVNVFTLSLPRRKKHEE